MSVTPSSLRSRDAVHAELTDLLGSGGPLSARPAEIAGFLDEDLLDQITDQYRAAATDVETDGRAVIITAGPPGAGKSSALDSLLDGHRRIDPDEIKDLLLDRLETAGLLAVRHDHMLGDGGAVMPGELAWWVHEAANQVAVDVRLMSLAAGENFAMEGTLEWVDLPSGYTQELADYDYETLTILDVEVSKTVAIEQARQRWWAGRRSGVLPGGRFMADWSFDRYYPSRHAVSITAARARTLYAEALDSGVEAQIACLSRDAAGNERTALIAADGTVGSWPAPGLYRTRPKGAVCIECGRPLTSDTSIRRGAGRHCAASA